MRSVSSPGHRANRHAERQAHDRNHGADRETKRPSGCAGDGGKRANARATESSFAGAFRHLDRGGLLLLRLALRLGGRRYAIHALGRASGR